MSTQYLTDEMAKKIADLYERMEAAYDRVARQLDFSCQGCPDNCCDSFFLHHTYLEWAYLWQGLEEVEQEQLREIEEKARRYVLESEKAMAGGERPQIDCPLLADGRCSLYGHRLMICRMHGVPALVTRPDGKKMEFPGCFRCQEMVAGRQDHPRVDRTELYRDLALLESEYLAHKRHVLPKVKMTIAQMIVKGPPHINHCIKRDSSHI